MKEIILSTNNNQDHYKITEKDGKKYLIFVEDQEAWEIQSREHLLDMLHNDAERDYPGAKKALEKAESLNLGEVMPSFEPEWKEVTIPICQWTCPDCSKKIEAQTEKRCKVLARQHYAKHL